MEGEHKQQMLNTTHTDFQSRQEAAEMQNINRILHLVCHHGNAIVALTVSHR